MKFIIMIVVLLTTNNTIRARSVGIIRNSSLRLNHSSNSTIYRSSCNECLCDLFTDTESESIVSLNCLMLNTSRVTCQLFNEGDYQTSSSYQMQINSNIIFYFLQLPSNNPSIVTTTTKLATTEGKISELSVVEYRLPFQNYKQVSVVFIVFLSFLLSTHIHNHLQNIFLFL